MQACKAGEVQLRVSRVAPLGFGYCMLCVALTHWMGSPLTVVLICLRLQW